VRTTTVDSKRNKMGASIDQFRDEVKDCATMIQSIHNGLSNNVTKMKADPDYDSTDVTDCQSAITYLDTIVQAKIDSLFP